MDNYTIVIMLCAITTLGTLCGTCVRFCYKSKCEDISLCCDCVKIHRNVEDEERIDEIEAQRSESPSPKPSIMPNMFNISHKV